MRRNLKMWWTNRRTDNNTHKPQWQSHFSKMIWQQHPNASPCTVGRTDEHMKWQQYHQHAKFYAIFSKWYVSETVWLNRCYKMVEIKWSMSYPCLMIPIMSSSIRFELKLFSGLPTNAPRPERVTNRQTQTQTQTQTKFIQQKYIQVPYQVYMSFLEIQITL